MRLVYKETGVEVKVGDKIEVPLYHISGNPEPQFFTYAQLRERKLKRKILLLFISRKRSASISKIFQRQNRRKHCLP